MASEAFQLAILLSLKDGASGGLDRFAARLRAAGKEGEKFANDFEKIRSELNRDFAIGAIGVSGLALIGKGVKVAGDFQASMTELRTSFSKLGKDGKVDMTALAGDMQRAEVVAMRLGNALPGTTEDFVQMMQVLKQNGLQVDTILNGAADAVGNLAVATNSVPREIAADFAQFGNLFKLRAQDFVPAADVFSRIYTSTGQTSQQLVEAAKYFQGRAGTNLGIGGLKDAEQMTRIFGLMGKQGMSGSMAGMGLTNFFNEYNTHRDKLKDLEKDTGIKLEFFDKKGKFVGMDSVIEQMSQFNKLSDSARSSWMETMFGTLGSGAANVLRNADAWKQFNAEQNQTIGLAAKNAEVSKNFNNQLEALKGSLTNLVVTGFGPLLPMLTSTATSANAVVGNLIEFAKANPGLVQTLGTLTLYGTTALAVYSGIKTLTAGFRMLKIAMAFSKGEAGLSFLTQTAASTQVATKNVAGFTSQVKAAEKQVGGLRGSLTGLANSGAVKIGVNIAAVVAAEYAITHLLNYLGEVQARLDKLREDSGSVAQNYDDLLGRNLLFKAPGEFTNEYDATARQFLNSIDESGMLMKNLHPERKGWTELLLGGNPYGVGPGGIDFSPTIAARRWQSKDLGKITRDPNVLASTVQQLRSSAGERGMTMRDVELITAAIEKMAGPEKWKATLDILASKGQPSTPAAAGKPFSPFGPTNNAFPNISGLNLTSNPFANLLTTVPPVNQSFVSLTDLTGKTTDAFGNLIGPADKLPAAFQRINSSADSVSTGLSQLGSRLSTWQPPASTSSPGTPLEIPPFAAGGHVRKTGIAIIHAGEDIVPARATPYSGGNAMTFNVYPTIQVVGGTKADSPEMKKVIFSLSKEIDRIVAKRVQRGRNLA